MGLPNIICFNTFVLSQLICCVMHNSYTRSSLHFISLVGVTKCFVYPWTLARGCTHSERSTQTWWCQQKCSKNNFWSFGIKYGQECVEHIFHECFSQYFQYVMISMWAAILLFLPSWFTWILQKLSRKKYVLNYCIRIGIEFRLKFIQIFFKKMLSRLIIVIYCYYTICGQFAFFAILITWIPTEMFWKISSNYLA